jgi:Uma2 family endonuclease
MSAAALDHLGPWTEADYLALPEQRQRIELLDGSLLVTPAPSVDHQQIARRLTNLVEAGSPAGWEAVEAVNVRVAPSRILIPDVVVISRRSDNLVCEAGDVRLVAEVVSPSTMATDRLLKPQLYAAAAIDWYLLLELRGGQPELIAHRLTDGAYKEHARAKPGQVISLPEPFRFRIDPGALLRAPR